jgi:aldose sugar dehydrogenase
MHPWHPSPSLDPASGPRPRTLASLLLALLPLAAACGEAPDARASGSAGGTVSAGPGEIVLDDVSTEYETLRVTRLAEMERPWAIAFLPDGDLLVTERGGTLYRISDDGPRAVSGTPEPNVQNQGGLLDVSVPPDHAETGHIFLTWSRPEGDGTVPALTRARLDDHALVEAEVVFQSNTPTSPGRHYGSRLLFLEDGTLLMTIGDRGAEPMRAQDPLDHSGTVVRLNPDGSVPADNPFVGNEAYAPEIYSYGHRNIQGIVKHPATGDIWATEHGPRGGDELNRIAAGANYGWPIATKGFDYRTQGPFGDAETWDHSEVGAAGPVHEFFPTLAPSGLTAVSGDTFQAWQGDLLAGGLRAERILRITTDGERVLHMEELLHGDIGRVRDVRQGPDGMIYVATEGDHGGIYRIEPAG